MTLTIDRSRRPAPDTPRDLRLPSFQRTTLPNGLRIEFARRVGVPEVSLRLVVEAGAAAEPAQRAGLADLSARLLTEGTPDRDAIDMARWLDRLGAAYDATAGYAVGSVSMHLLSEVLDEAVEFLAATVRHAAFPEREVERLRGERLDEIARRLDEPATVANHALIAALFEDGLYGRPVGGTATTVSEIEPHDVRAFHAARYGPEGGLLLACGDVEFEQVVAAARTHLDDWSGTSLRLDPPDAPEPRGGDVLLLDRPGSPQAEVRVGAHGAAFGTPDHHAIIVANAILGGLFNSRINMNLREDKGWTYGARSGFRFRRGAGPFVVRTAVETGVTADAFEEILAEIDAMTREPVTEDELALAKHALTLSLPLQFESASQITAKVSRQRIYDLPEDYWEVYRARIEAVTPEQILGVCQTYLARERLTLLAVTDGDAVESGLGGLGRLERRPAS